MKTTSKPSILAHKDCGFLNQLIRIPHLCLLCHDWNAQRICQRCQSYFSRPSNPCQSCGIPLRHKSLLCGACLKQKPEFDQVLSAFIYRAPIDKLIHHFKEHGNEVIGRGLSEIFLQAINAHYQQHHLDIPQYLVAVPLQWRKQWWRGFNHADILCDYLSRSLNIPKFTKVKRLRSAPDQKNLSRQQRLQNLKNCFDVVGSLHGKTIAIVDDVMTTGATTNALTKALKEAGAKKVTIWALTRTPIKN